MEFLFHLFADLGWSDVFLPIKRMDHVQLFLRDQFIHNLNAVPLWQPARNQKFKSAADIQTHKKKGLNAKFWATSTLQNLSFISTMTLSNLKRKSEE